MRAPAPHFLLLLLWPLRPRHVACLALLVPLLAVAQVPITADAADAARPDAATAPITYQSLSPQPPLSAATPSAPSWQQAHDAVGAFPRGHADIVAWETRQNAAPAAGATPTPKAPDHRGIHGGGDAAKNPAHSHHPTHGGKP
ncbi:MAG: hypothetical protein Q8N13_00625 [Acidovorax sp.]|nr:hypothetical protein [Acidovorax sp.]